MENKFGMNLKPVKDDIKRIVTAYLQEIEDAKAADAEAEEEGGGEGEAPALVCRKGSEAHRSIASSRQP